MEELEEKRRDALKQYIGASCIYQYCFSAWFPCYMGVGTEMSSMALTIHARVDEMFETIYSCRAGLSSESAVYKHTCSDVQRMENHDNPRLAEKMSLPCHCPKGYQHGKCEGGQAGKTAYYTPEMARKINKAITLERTQCSLQEELQGNTCLLAGFHDGRYCVCVSI